MPELRQDPTTFDWVILAKERAKRPDELGRVPEETAAYLKTYRCKGKG